MKCLIKDCPKNSSVREYCRAHYEKFRRHGDPLWKRPIFIAERCKAKDCERAAVAKKLCHTHYRKFTRTGTLDKIIGTATWRKNLGEARLSPLSQLDKTRDPSRRGYLAANLVNDLRNKARARGILWALESLDAFRFITSACFYCGHRPKWPEERVGIDRVDNLKGYLLTNCVSACFSCNSAKGSKTTQEFLDWIERIHSHQLSQKKP